MNRFASASAALMIAGLSPAVWGQSSESGSTLVAPFKPGLTWKVEELPQNRKILFRGDAGSRPETSAPAAAGDAVLIEENTIIADGFRKQILPTDKLTRYIRGSLVITENSSGTDFSIESLDLDLARDRISSSRVLEFDWIAPQWRIGTALVEGVECDIFSRPWPYDSTEENSDAASASPRPDHRIYAAVGRADKLPRRLESPVAVKRYLFTMTNPLPELPAGAVLAIHRMNESAKEMAQRYAVPQ